MCKTSYEAGERYATRKTCEDVLGIFGIGNGTMLAGHKDDEDLPAITAGLLQEHENKIKGRLKKTVDKA